MGHLHAVAEQGEVEHSDGDVLGLVAQGDR